MQRWLAALGLLCSLSVHAQSPVWALRGAHNTVYLAESVHLLKADESTLPPAFEQAYAAAKTIVMEIDLSSLDPAAVQDFMLEHGVLKGTTLRQTLGEQHYRQLATEAARLELPMEGLEPLAPWAIALMLTDVEYLKLGYDPDQGVEMQIERRAEKDGKPIRGLETLQEQLGQLEGLTAAQQARFLELTLDDMHDAQQDTDELLRAWRAGDTQHLADLMSREYREFPELYRALVTQRNVRWLPQIQSFLKDNHDYMVVVGALHLVGRDGLLELMHRAGNDAVPVRAAATAAAATAAH
jgi:uncharacterized protein YbaP (TraB family)